MNIYCNDISDIKYLDAVLSNGYIACIEQINKSCVKLIINRECKEHSYSVCRIREICEVTINNVVEVQNNTAHECDIGVICGISGYANDNYNKISIFTYKTSHNFQSCSTIPQLVIKVNSVAITIESKDIKYKEFRCKK